MAAHKSSSVTIDEYELPKGKNAFGSAVAIFLLILSARRKFIQPGSPLHDQLIARSAVATKYSIPVQDGLFYTLYGLHLIEAIWFGATKMRKHNVKLLGSTWFKWSMSVFLTGVWAQDQWNQVVERKNITTIEEIKSRQKHML